MLLVLSLSFFLSYLPCQYTGSLNPTVKQQMQQQQQCWDYSFYTSSGWPKFAYVTNPVPPEIRSVTYKLHFQGHSCFRFFLSSTLHARHIHACFELWGRPFRLSLIACFFLPSCLPFGVAMKGIQSTPFIFLICFAHYLFLSSRGCLLDSLNIGCSACIYSMSLVSLNDKLRLAHQRQQSVSSAFQFHYTAPESTVNAKDYFIPLAFFFRSSTGAKQ